MALLNSEVILIIIVSNYSNNNKNGSKLINLFIIRPVVTSLLFALGGSQDPFVLKF